MGTDCGATCARIVREIDPAVGVDSIADLESLRHGSLVRPRFYAVLVGMFAAIAGIIAAVGIYAALAFAVVQRTHEIGVRMALGARRHAVLIEVLRRGVLVTVLGVGIGLAVAAALTGYSLNDALRLVPPRYGYLRRRRVWFGRPGDTGQLHTGASRHDGRSGHRPSL